MKSTNDAEQDSQHEPFISVLKRVVVILAPLCPAVSTLNNVTDANNGKESLDIYDTATGVPSVAAALTSSTPSLPMLLHVVCEPECDILDAQFVVDDFFRELGKICEHVTETWVKLRSGELDLMTAWLVTSMALDPVRNHEDQLIKSDPILAMPELAIMLRTSSVYRFPLQILMTMLYSRYGEQIMAMHGGERHLNSRSYTAVLFRDRYVGHSRITPSLGASSRLVARIRQVVEDLMTTGVVSPLRPDEADANFSGRSLQPILDALNLTPTSAAGVVLRRGARIDLVVLLEFVGKVVNSEHDLLRFSLLSLQLDRFDKGH
ncbi:hypothetical protein GGF31_006524 [Allomyces arbusculus]|nr:hypothetical protein GGF31_006524 [Allomyces arbusculus]